MIIILMKPLFLQMRYHGMDVYAGADPGFLKGGGGHQILRSTSKKKVGWGRMGWGGQGSHGHGKSWKILKFETILESHGKVSPSVLCTMYGYGNLVDCIYKFTTFFHALS